MVAWLIPALKAVLPHVGTIIAVAAPAFTKKKVDATVDPSPLLQQQISELQAAVSQNSADIKELAAQLESTVKALELAACVAESKLRRVLLFCFAAIALSAVAVSVALFLAFAR